MIRTLALTHKLELLSNIPLEKLSSPEISWYWVDFNAPDEEEAMVLSNHFHFHPLAIEDCLHFLQRPKLDYYDGYDFFVLHALHQQTLQAEEMDVFIGKNYLVSIHLNPLREIDEVWERVLHHQDAWTEGPVYAAYLLIDKLVDYYFPAIHQIEDEVNELDSQIKKTINRKLMDEVFVIRGDLLRLRRTVNSMRDLLYRILNSERLEGIKEHQIYFVDIHDHLLKLSEMIESSREITADIRDSYLSVNSHRMNNIMVTLTIITSIFIPLTFIAGIYGMNFEYMPELQWRYGYFIVLGFMLVVGVSMFLWFKRKGWLDT